MKIISLQRNTTIRHGASEEALSVVLDDNGVSKPLTINADHPNWDLFQTAIADYTAGNITNEQLASKLYNNVNLARKAEEKFVKVGGILDGRMVIANDRILVDHAPIEAALEGHILRLLRADGTPKDAQNWRAFAKFVENLYSNTSDFVRQQLFGWLNYENLKGHGFTLTPDGCFIGYKGCAGTPTSATSISTGTAIVNGEVHHGAIPNPIGAVVEMPRNKVQDDPSVGCSTGLHVGTYAYANSFQRGVLLTVKVNPRDVVSVPTECDAQKIRTCRYTVLEAVEAAYNEMTWDDEGYCDLCDDYDCTCDGQDSDTFTVGDTIEFSYTRKDGQVNDYSITVTYEDDTWVEGRKANGDGRSFYRSRMRDVSVKGASAAPTVTAPSSPATPAAKTGEVVSFTYTRRDGKVKNYEVAVSHRDHYYLDGELTNGDGYRSFIVSRITDLKNVNAPQTDEAKVSEDEAVKNGASPEASTTASAFVNSLVNTLMGSLGEVLEDLHSTLSEEVSDDEDPGSEEDEEIRRNGYGSDPWA